METNVNYTLIGIFVISLISFLILSVIWLSAGFSSNTYVIYQVNMTEAVSGLNSDAPVEYNGVNVGSVKSIQINFQRPRIVELLLKIKSNTPITQGTRAKLDVRSLSGAAYIALEDKGKNLTPLRAQAGQPYPVIETLPSIFMRVDSALTQLNNNFQAVTDSLQALLNNQNLRSFKQLLEGSQNTVHLFETQTIPEINQAIINLNAITHDLSDVAFEMKQNPAILIRGKQQPALGPGEK